MSLLSLVQGTARIAACRNDLLAQARRDLTSFDYYFVVDVDIGSSSSFDSEDFLSNFIYPPSSWIAMTATTRTEYYDIWALRLRSMFEFDCWQRIDELTSFYIDQSFLIKSLIKIHQKPIPRHIPIIEVQSAFGGAAVYSGKYLDSRCQYDGVNKQKWWWWWWNYEQCEHVHFHQCLQKYAKQPHIYINPRFQMC